MAYYSVLRVAYNLMEGNVPVMVTSTHFYNPKEASPQWADSMRVDAIVGDHIFLTDERCSK